MPTTYQLNRRELLKKKNHTTTPALKKNPQAKATVMRVRIVTPRKPNSARRPVIKGLLFDDTRVTAHIPGIGHNLRRHSNVLVRGGGARDLPGVGYTCCRGVYDFAGVLNKRRRRSVYGVKWPDTVLRKRRRIFRKILG
jgi:small subunit ribosomal protein S12